MSSGTFDDWVAEISRAAPAEAARLLNEAFTTTAENSLEFLDQAVIGLLAKRTGDGLLGYVSLDALRGLSSRIISRLESAGPESSRELQRDAWGLLDVLRRNGVLRRIAEPGIVDEWAETILRLVESSHFTFGRLFRERVSRYAERTLFRLPGNGGKRTLSWRETSERVTEIERGLVALTIQDGTEDRPVALLSENRLEVALLDMACLGGGIVNVMIPANATDKDVAYILGHAGVGTVIASTREQMQKVLLHRDNLPGLRRAIALDRIAASAPDVLRFDELLKLAGRVPLPDVERRRDGVRIDDLATVMYTSGTTGMPKGIMFSQRNIVYKRFARALALPEIGEDDRFLCYLPLFHTFGRFLELAACVFWGSTYCFAESPAIDTLIRQMGEVKPTVFVSIPMKWMQLYERVRQEVDVELADDTSIREGIRRVTGGHLRWGLSAAGYLDPDIFRFFQRHGIELMSGFGMTEATGGITMTPPGRYKEGSLGRALPGVALRFADDGELKIRGPYVMMGYLDPPDKEASFDEDGWLATGDIMEKDEDDFIRLVDRKKEIYKNIKGQTIAPQKIENLFRDFDSVGRIFLVGDHRHYNTALIYPNPEFQELDFGALSREEKKAHFRSLVVSANSFVEPFERIVDFAVIDRDFEAGHGELTPKGTFKRKVIEDNFKEIIELLYRRTTMTVGDVKVTVPNWLFQKLGITTSNLHILSDSLRLTTTGTSLTLRKHGGDETQVGSVLYRSGAGSVRPERTA